MKIFSFPHVVVNELVKEFELVDLINLSFCSKKSHALVKSFSKIKGDLEIESLPYKSYRIQFNKQELVDVFWEHGAPETHYSLKWMYQQYRLLRVCQDAAVGLRETTNYICDLLKTPVSTVTIDKEEDLWMLEFAETRQKEKLKHVFIAECFVRGANYSRILKCNTESLACEGRPPPGFRYPGKLPPANRLMILDGSWVTRGHLLGLESSIAQLYGANLISSDVNAMLKFWLRGGLPNLKHLTLDWITLDDEVYEGLHDLLERSQQDEEVLLRDEVEVEPNATSTSKCYRIRREDNMVAIVMFDEEKFVMNVERDIN